MFGFNIETVEMKELLAAELKGEAAFLHNIADDHYKCQNALQGSMHRMLAESYERIAEHLVPQAKPKGRL